MKKNYLSTIIFFVIFSILLFMCMTIIKEKYTISSTQSPNNSSCTNFHSQRCIKTKDECFKLCHDNISCKAAEFTNSHDTAKELGNLHSAGCTLFSEEDYSNRTTIQDAYSKFAIVYDKNDGGEGKDDWYSTEDVNEILKSLNNVTLNPNTIITASHENKKGCFIHSCDDTDHLNTFHPTTTAATTAAI
jgi:hypothetical protein